MASVVLILPAIASKVSERSNEVTHIIWTKEFFNSVLEKYVLAKVSMPFGDVNHNTANAGGRQRSNNRRNLSYSDFAFRGSGLAISCTSDVMAVSSVC